MSTRCIEFTTRLHQLELEERHEYAFSECDGPKMPVVTAWLWRDETGSINKLAPQLSDGFPNLNTINLSDSICQSVPFIGVYFTKCAGSWHLSWHVRLSETFSGVPGKPLPRTSLSLDMAIDERLVVRQAKWCELEFQARSSHLAMAVQPYSKKTCYAIKTFDPVPIMQQIDKLNILN